MKLYTIPGHCSTAIHIALQWTQQPFDVEIMMRGAKPAEFLLIHPSGTVPLLVDGDLVLNQGAAILGYIADTYPDAQLFGAGSARERAEATRWLAFANADLHPGFAPMFEPHLFSGDTAHHDAIRAAALARVRSMFEQANAHLSGRQWLAGFRSCVDAYLYVVLRWTDMFALDLSDLSHLMAFRQRMEADADVQAVLKAEGLG